MKLILNPVTVNDWKNQQDICTNQASPEIANTLVKDLHSSPGKGAQLFAKRKKKAEKWVVDENPQPLSMVRGQDLPGAQMTPFNMSSMASQQQSSVKKTSFQQTTTSSSSSSQHMHFEAVTDPGRQVDLQQIKLSEVGERLSTPRVQVVKSPWDAAMESKSGKVDKAFIGREEIIANRRSMSPAPTPPGVPHPTHLESQGPNQSYLDSDLYKPAHPKPWGNKISHMDYSSNLPGAAAASPVPAMTQPSATALPPAAKQPRYNDIPTLQKPQVQPDHLPGLQYYQQPVQQPSPTHPRGPAQHQAPAHQTPLLQQVPVAAPGCYSSSNPGESDDGYVKKSVRERIGQLESVINDVNTHGMANPLVGSQPVLPYNLQDKDRPKTPSAKAPMEKSSRPQSQIGSRPQSQMEEEPMDEVSIAAQNIEHHDVPIAQLMSLDANAKTKLIEPAIPLTEAEMAAIPSTFKLPQEPEYIEPEKSTLKQETHFPYIFQENKSPAKETSPAPTPFNLIDTLETFMPVKSPSATPLATPIQEQNPVVVDTPEPYVEASNETPQRESVQVAPETESEPVPEPVSEPVPEPVSEPEPEPVPEPVSEPEPVPVIEEISEPKPAPTEAPPEIPAPDIHIEEPVEEQKDEFHDAAEEIPPQEETQIIEETQPPAEESPMQQEEPIEVPEVIVEEPMESEQVEVTAIEEVITESLEEAVPTDDVPMERAERAITPVETHGLDAVDEAPEIYEEESQEEILKKLLGDNFDPSAPVTMPQIEQPVGLETEDGPVGVIASLMPLSEIEAHIPEPPVEEPVREPTPDDPKNYQMFEQNPTDSTRYPRMIYSKRSGENTAVEEGRLTTQSTVSPSIARTIRKMANGLPAGFTLQPNGPNANNTPLYKLQNQKKKTPEPVLEPEPEPEVEPIDPLRHEFHMAALMPLSDIPLEQFSMPSMPCLSEPVSNVQPSYGVQPITTPMPPRKITPKDQSTIPPVQPNSKRGYTPPPAVAEPLVELRKEERAPRPASMYDFTDFNTAARGWGGGKSYYKPVTFT